MLLHALLGALLPSRLLLLSAAVRPPVHAAAAADYPSRTGCKSVPGSASWPSPQVWARLNESTGGRLLQPAPPGAVCHPGEPSYDAAKCPGVQSEWSSYEFHESDPVSSMWNQYNNDSCLPYPSDPCSHAGYPVFVINATTARHVQLGVDFGDAVHNIRLVVKSTGHDYIGRSSAPNSLSIWTHHLKGMAFHEASFRPRGCDVEIEGPALTAGAGSQMGEIYEFLDAYNQTIVGGGGATVSLGGYLTGGGHSLLSSRYGLASDQVLQMDVVTPAGDAVTINECSHPDLFWAMRGGGGSTFAVMTSVTVQTHPTPQLTELDFLLGAPVSSPSAGAVADLAAYVLGQFPRLSDSGVSGYSYVLTAVPNPLDGGATTIAGMAGLMALQDVQNASALLDLWAPVFAHVNQTWPGYALFASTSTYASFWQWFQTHHDTSPTGADTYVGSRLLDGPALTANASATSDAFRRFSSGGASTAYLVAGRGVWNARPRGGSNAVLQAWRKAYVHATCGVSFAPLNTTAKAKALAEVQYLVEGLRQLAPDSGAYMNEADPAEPGWQHQFWGANYARLAAIKRAVDPDDVLWCHPCVGNERWAEAGGRLCRT